MKPRIPYAELFGDQKPKIVAAMVGVSRVIVRQWVAKGLPWFWRDDIGPARLEEIRNMKIDAPEKKFVPTVFGNERKRTDLTARQVRGLFYYDHASGMLIRKKRHRATKVIGDYARIRVGKQIYAAHRLIWMYFHGEWPSSEIDHINGIKSDNRIANLRDVTHSINMQNIRSATKISATGVLGACPFRDKFQAQIKLNHKIIHIGLFDSVTDAGRAYVAVKRTIHEGCTI